MNYRIGIVGLSVLITTGCSTLTKSTILGSAIGATTGALLGSAINQNGGDDEKSKGALIGGAVGGVAGGFLGYYEHKQMEEKEKQAKLLPPRLIPKSKDNLSVPALTTPEVRRVWVPEKIEGNTFIEGHYIYVIDRGSEWSR